MKKNPRPSLLNIFKRDIGAIAFICALISGIILFVYLSAFFELFGELRSGEILNASAKNNRVFRSLDGREAKSKDDRFEIYSVVIDNRNEGRPVMGLSYAGVVYELPVEGKFTRLLAFFPEDAPLSEIGPIRSLRPYFLDIIKEYSGFVMHAGGSPQALAMVRGMNSINEISSLGRYFRRDSSRSAPYNLFIDRESIEQALDDLGDEEEKFRSWLFKDDPPLEARKKSDTAVKLGEEIFIYNVKSNSYDWTRNNVQEKDGSNNRKIKAKNIIAMKTAKPRVMDSEGRLELKLLGKGEAVIYRDGGAVKGFWRKDKAAERVRWIDKDGKDIPLRRGLTWVYVSS